MKTYGMMRMVVALALGLGLGLRFGAVQVDAAEITYAGSQTGIETMLAAEEDPPRGWRNQLPAKPLDIDGDNILGTDGYYVPGPAQDTTTIVKPSYFSSWARLTTARNAAARYIDNPADPTGPDTIMDQMWRGGRATDGAFWSFAVTGDYLADRALSVCMLVPENQSTEGFVLRQTVGGDREAAAESINVGAGLGAIFWVVEAPRDGDQFLIVGTGGQTYGLVADSAPLPPKGTVVIFR